MRVLPATFVLAASAASQSTWIVDDTPGPGVHFTSLPAAVAAAANGDTLLVAAGSYEPFRVSGKALTIRGAGSSVTVIDQPPAAAAADYVAIDAVPAAAVFRLSGVSVRRVHPQRLVLRGSGASTGAIVLDGVASASAPGGTSDGPGLLVRNALVHAHRCDIVGGTTPTGGFSGQGHVGVLVDTGAVLVADGCTLRGGDGISSMGNASSGGGLYVIGATCRLSGCAVRGGHAYGVLAYLAISGAGVTAGGASTVTIVGNASDVVAGGGVTGSYFLLGSGIESSSPAVVDVHGAVAVTGGTNGSFVGLPTNGATITLGLPALPRLRWSGTTLGNGALPAAQPATLSLDQGPPGQLFVLLADLRPAFTAVPGLALEPLLLTGTAVIASVGLLGANGVSTSTAVPATQMPYVVGIETHWQGFVFDAAAGRWLGSNAALLRVEP